MKSSPLHFVARSRSTAALPLSFLVMTLACAVAFAQKDAGGIAGTVRDSSGAVVAEAKVTITDADRGTSFVTTTNQQGDYVASPLKIGRYTVTVEKQGFKKVQVGPVDVSVQARSAVNVTLQVGSISETMTVTTQGPQLETETSDLGQVVDSHTISTLPLNGRNYAQLALLGAGVAPAEPGSREAASYGFSANGARSLQNNFQLDGVDNNSNLADLLNETTYVIQPSVDAIAEFKVQTNAYSAEFGRGNGAVMNAVIKSGSNQVHGDIYEYVRNEKLDARNAFDEFGRQPYKQNQFGFTLGGPIVKNHTFFFGDYEGLRVRQATPFLNTIPTQAMRQADFSALLPPVLNSSTAIPGVLDCSGNPTYPGEIFNTYLTNTSSSNPSGYCGVPIAVDGSGNPTNLFPSSLIDPLAARLAALYPNPNSTLPGGNYLVEPKRQETRNNFDVRVDHKFSQNDNFFARFSYENQPSIIPGTFSNVLDGGGFFQGIEDNSYRSVALSETHLFTPALVNEFRLGYNRINSHRLQTNYNKNISGDPTYGINFPGVPYVSGTDNGGLPNITFGDGSAGIGSYTFLPSREIQNTYILNENLTWVRGRHSMKYGTEIRREQFTIFQPAASRGALSFGSQFTDNPGTATTGSGGSAFASMLLGIPDFVQITNMENVDYRRQSYAFYANDDMKATSRLTLNLGLRWELNTTLKEAQDRMATFDSASASLIVPKGQTAQLTPTVAASVPLLATGSRGLIRPDLNNFAPRVGFAYQITDKLVLRSAYGIFYGGQENGPYSNPSMGFNPPFFATELFGSPPCSAASANSSPGQTDCSISFQSGNGSTYLNKLRLGFPPDILSNPNSPEFFSLSPKLETPYNQQWHFGFQYQLPSSTVLDISYAGSRGLKLYAFYNGNQAVPYPDLAAPTIARRPVHKASPAATGPCDFNPPTYSDSANCDPVFDTAIYTLRSNGFSNYHSLQARLQKRMSHGLQFEFSYTYAHALDDASSASLGSYASGDFRDQRYPQTEYGNADFDVRHRFVASYFYELPFGKGKNWGGNADGFLNQIIGNWQLAGIVSASTGNYFTPTDSATNLANSDGGGDVATPARPNRVGDPNTKPCISGTLFNTCAFVTNTIPGTFGNAGRNLIRGPGFQNWDISLFKSFPVNERYRFEFRTEFFNVWNHMNPRLFPNTFQFGTPATVHALDVPPGTNGCPIDNQNQNCAWGFPQGAADPRFIQFALKFYF